VLLGAGETDWHDLGKSLRHFKWAETELGERYSNNELALVSDWPPIGMPRGQDPAVRALSRSPGPSMKAPEPLNPPSGRHTLHRDYWREQSENPQYRRNDAPDSRKQITQLIDLLSDTIRIKSGITPPATKW